MYWSDMSCRCSLTDISDNIFHTIIIFRYILSSIVRECFVWSTNGPQYKGKNTCTDTGRICQRWDSDYPHRRNMSFVPPVAKYRSNNYCFGTKGRKPWCYTTDPQVRWEFCHVAVC